jgi:hypothetical protein
LAALLHEYSKIIIKFNEYVKIIKFLVLNDILVSGND